MKSIGQAIKEVRTKKKMSLGKLAVVTKIRKEFIEAIENENWLSLPEYPVVTGFVKNIYQALDLDARAGVALLRRDYPPKKLTINPKPDVSKEFIWSPKFTFFAGITLVAVSILGYLIFQYINFISPPKLIVDTPTEGQVITSVRVAVSGITDSEASVKVNNQPVIIEEDGKFTTNVEVVTDTKEVIVIAKSRSGKETVISRKIDVELGNRD